ncbi:MAG: hypothetical protein NTV82_02190, partial [Candidatus Aminicenantes bacterium]|nr:hypothetical protein [Candidatus Aminicenantes bacterium]
MGILGLAAYSAEQRTKEIGVRKVLGSSIPGIVALLSTRFSLWILAANLIAWSIAYYAMNRWLQGFAYRTGLRLDLFVCPGRLHFVVRRSTPYGLPVAQGRRRRSRQSPALRIENV